MSDALKIGTQAIEKWNRDKLRRDTRHDSIGPVRLMASAERYVMVRRPGCMPFVMAENDWLVLPTAPNPHT